MAEFKYIRDEGKVYERVEGTNRFVLHKEFPSISAAKHWTNKEEKKEKGCVRRRESLERTLGPTTVREMLK